MIKLTGGVGNEKSMSEQIRVLARDVWRDSREHEAGGPHKGLLLERIGSIKDEVPMGSENPLLSWLGNLERTVIEA